MNKLKISKGEWWFTDGRELIVMMSQVKVSNSIGGATVEEAKANGKLMEDAGETAQKCDLLPSELLKQRDELLNELKQVNKLFTELIQDERMNAMLKVSLRIQLDINNTLIEPHA